MVTDPFDLPDWLGTALVTWVADDGLRGSWRVAGRLCDDQPGDQRREHACDLVAVDLAYPSPVVADDLRVRAHQAWQHGQVLVLADRAAGDASPVVLAVPGSSFTADLAIDAVARLALAVGASPDRYAVHLRIGHER